MCIHMYIYIYIHTYICIFQESSYVFLFKKRKKKKRTQYLSKTCMITTKAMLTSLFSSSCDFTKGGKGALSTIMVD